MTKNALLQAIAELLAVQNTDGLTNNEIYKKIATAYNYSGPNLSTNSYLKYICEQATGTDPGNLTNAVYVILIAQSFGADIEIGLTYQAALSAWYLILSV